MTYDWGAALDDGSTTAEELACSAEEAGACELGCAEDS